MLKWNLNTAMGELIGSFVLTLGVIFITWILKRKKMEGSSIATLRLYKAITLFAIVVIAIIIARGFGNQKNVVGGAINPAVAFMVHLYEGKWASLPLVMGFDFIGGILAAFIFIGFKLVYNSRTDNTEKIELDKIFTLSTQPVVKSFTVESIANIFWYLPIVAMIMLENNFGGSQGGTRMLVPLMAGFAVMLTVTIVPEIGIAHLNPQVWLGEFILKLSGTKGKISIKQLSGELSGLASTFIVAAAIGGIAMGINPYKK